MRKIEERVWQEELQRGKHLPGYGGYVSVIEDSPANDIELPRRHFRDMEDWGGKQVGYGGHKPMVLARSKSHKRSEQLSFRKVFIYPVPTIQNGRKKHLTEGGCVGYI